MRIKSIVDLLDILEEEKEREERRKYLVRILKVPENMRGRRIADIDRSVGPFREEDIVVVSSYLAKALEDMGIGKRYSPVGEIKQPPKVEDRGDVGGSEKKDMEVLA